MANDEDARERLLRYRLIIIIISSDEPHFKYNTGFYFDQFKSFGSVFHLSMYL